jgi:hypothetical protein
MEMFDCTSNVRKVDSMQPLSRGTAVRTDASREYARAPKANTVATKKKLGFTFHKTQTVMVDDSVPGVVGAQVLPDLPPGGSIQTPSMQ